MKKGFILLMVAACQGSVASAQTTGSAARSERIIPHKPEFVSESLPVHHIQAEQGQAAERTSEISSAGSWKVVAQSMNVYGVLESNAKPLQYNDELNAVSFVHRKGPTYVPRPFPTTTGAETGAIYAVLTTDWGLTWDTTLLWNDETYWARYPQGAIHNPPGNLEICDAYMVGSGPVTGAPGLWQGSFFASKPLDVPGSPLNNDTVSTVFGANSFIANTSPFPYGKFDFSGWDFTATDNGSVKALGYLVNDANGTTTTTFGWQGAAVIQGTNISGSFAWKSDTIIPDFMIAPNGTRYISAQPHMAWNEDGSVGYVWFIGVRDPRGQVDTLRNMGFQPIVYRWTKTQPMWTEIPRINFNDPAFKSVTDHILSVQGDTLEIPFFNLFEGIDGVVDRNNRLHIVATIGGTFSKHPDSLDQGYLIPHADGEQYRFGHRPGLRPYIYDFTETPMGWKVTLIDSMSSESPSTEQGKPGFNYNPWDASGGTSGGEKVSAGARIQVSRTPDGQYILYTWSESDTNFTSQGSKWNQLPDVKSRLGTVGLETGSAAASLTVHPTEINITSPLQGQSPNTKHPQVTSRATMHYISPKMVMLGQFTFGLPITVSNNPNFQQQTTVNHYYLSAGLQFNGSETTNIPAAPQESMNCITGITSHQRETRFELRPNPASDQVLVTFGEPSQEISIRIFDSGGRLVHETRSPQLAGKTTVAIDVSGLSAGLYLVRAGSGSGVTCRKLVVEK